MRFERFFWKYCIKIIGLKRTEFKDFKQKKMQIIERNASTLSSVKLGTKQTTETKARTLENAHKSNAFSLREKQAGAEQATLYILTLLWIKLCARFLLIMTDGNGVRPKEYLLPSSAPAPTSTELEAELVIFSCLYNHPGEFKFDLIWCQYQNKSCFIC